MITGLCLVTWLLAACEPASVTEARLQLGRGGERITGLTIPITQDTLAISDFLSDTTSINGLVGVNFGADSVNVDVGNQLKFDNITLTGITVDVPSGGFAAGGTFERPHTALLRELALRLDDLVNFLGGRPFFYADRLSMADLAVHSMLVFLREDRIPGAALLLAARPTLVLLLERVEAATGGHDPLRA